MHPPLAPRKPHQHTYHGQSFEDPWFWLREKENPEVKAYLEAENAYTKEQLKNTEILQETLYNEMLGRIQEDDSSVPVRKGSYLYYTRTELGKAYSIHCRKRNETGAQEEVMLDENELAKGHDFFDLGAAEVSPDERLLAFATDINGYEEYTLFVKDLTTGELLADQVARTSGSVEWAGDNRTLFYVTLDAAHRPYRLWSHTLGQAEDRLVHEETDEAYFLGLSKTRDERYLLLELGSMVSSEIHYLDALRPQGTFTLIQPREKKIEYSVEHREGWFWIVTNADGATNFKLVKAPVAQCGRPHWQEVLPYDASLKIDAAEPFQNHVVLVGRKGGFRALIVLQPESGERYEVSFPDAVYTAALESNPEYKTSVLRFTYSSPVTPPSVFDFNMETRERTLLKEQPVKGGYDRSLYDTARTYARAQDGTLVPISLVWRRDRRSGDPQPLFLYGYGSYGHSLEPQFSSARLSLLDRGLIFAIAHIRGGGEMGRTWYDSGKFLQKKNTFTDFIACAEYLVGEGYTEPGKLVIAGGSAGGLLMGAVTNLRPDLFRAVLAQVPFVDVINTMMDPSIPLTVIEYDEWGNPQDKAYFDYMLSYSPYDNVEAKEYPDMMITAGLNDPRVHYWEPAKLCSKLRHLKKGDSMLLLKVNMDAGHQGASGRYGYLREIATDYAFLLDRLGVNQ
jgi:oligopeptidase B